MVMVSLVPVLRFLCFTFWPPLPGCICGDWLSIRRSDCFLLPLDRVASSSSSSTSLKMSVSRVQVSPIIQIDWRQSIHPSFEALVFWFSIGLKVLRYGARSELTPLVVLTASSSGGRSSGEDLFPAIKVMTFKARVSISSVSIHVSRLSSTSRFPLRRLLCLGFLGPCLGLVYFLSFVWAFLFWASPCNYLCCWTSVHV